MKPIEYLKNTNTVLIFILLIGTMIAAGYFLIRLRKPLDTIHVSVDSVQLKKK